MDRLSVIPHRHGPIVQVNDNRWQLQYVINKNIHEWVQLEVGDYPDAWYESFDLNRNAVAIKHVDQPETDVDSYEQWKRNHLRWIREQNAATIERELSLGHLVSGEVPKGWDHICKGFDPPQRVDIRGHGRCGLCGTKRRWSHRCEVGIVPGFRTLETGKCDHCGMERPQA